MKRIRAACPTTGIKLPMLIVWRCVCVLMWDVFFFFNMAEIGGFVLVICNHFPLILPTLARWHAQNNENLLKRIAWAKLMDKQTTTTYGTTLLLLPNVWWWTPLAHSTTHTHTPLHPEHFYKLLNKSPGCVDTANCKNHLIIHLTNFTFNATPTNQPTHQPITSGQMNFNKKLLPINSSPKCKLCSAT